MGDRPKRKAAQVPSDQPAPQKRKRPVCSLTATLLSVDVPVRCARGQARARGLRPLPHLLFPMTSGCRMWGITNDLNLSPRDPP
eukprot:COSAG03_NODE_25169_length_267_cov_0.845238_1_plen_83_part_10